MKKFFVFIFVFCFVYFGAMAMYQWENLVNGRILPPQIMLENCGEVREEVDKYDWDREVALAIAKAESKCDTNARGDTELVFHENGREYGYSVGVFQVRILPGREECDTFDLSTNVKCAYDLYLKAERKFEDWTMYLNGNYKNYMWHSPF